MLILCRKKDEKIVIGEGQNAIVVTVVEVIGNKVRITNPNAKPHHEIVDINDTHYIGIPH